MNKMMHEERGSQLCYTRYETPCLPLLLLKTSFAQRAQHRKSNWQMRRPRYHLAHVALSAMCLQIILKCPFRQRADQVGLQTCDSFAELC
jgi:hypothetical protein